VIFANSVFPVIVRTAKSEEEIVRSVRSVLSVTTTEPLSFFAAVRAAVEPLPF